VSIILPVKNNPENKICANINTLPKAHAIKAKNPEIAPNIDPSELNDSGLLNCCAKLVKIGDEAVNTMLVAMR